MSETGVVAFTFLTTDIAVGMTFSRIASFSRQHSERRARNQQRARQAYDAVLHYGSLARLTQAQRVDVDRRLAQLKFALERLGEVF